MRYLFFFICLPYCVVAQQQDFFISATQCQPNQFIRINIRTFIDGQCKIFRKPENGDFKFLKSVDYRNDKLTFIDSSSEVRTGQVFYYYYQVQGSGFVSNQVGGYVCLNADTIPIVPYETEQDNLDTLDFNWSKLQDTSKYQIQVARNQTDFSIKTGFPKTFLLLDSIVNTNRLQWNFKTTEGDTLYWAVRQQTINGNSYYTNPYRSIIGQVFYSAKKKYHGDINLSELELIQNKISISIKNQTFRILDKIELHYYESDSKAFPSKSRLIETKSVDKLPAFKTTIVTIPLKSLKRYLIVIPSIDGQMYTILKKYIKIK